MRDGYTEIIVSPSSSSYFEAEPVAYAAPDAKLLRELKNPFILQLEAPLSLLHSLSSLLPLIIPLLSTVLVIHDRSPVYLRDILFGFVTARAIFLLELSENRLTDWTVHYHGAIMIIRLTILLKSRLLINKLTMMHCYRMHY
jgi:hypothetical protein